MKTNLEKLSFSRKGNAKLSERIATFSLPAGHSCPGAKACLAKVIAGKLIDGSSQEFRCFSASAELFRPNVHASRIRNFNLLKAAQTVRGMARLILASLPRNRNTVRIHVSGDFFSETYFLAWIVVARIKSDVIFYAYTKSLTYWLKHKDKIPSNLRLTASRGGKWDALIDQYMLPNAQVVFNKAEAKLLALPIDHTDAHAIKGTPRFALLIHGPGKPGSLQAKIHHSGIHSYPAPSKNQKKPTTNIWKPQRNQLTSTVSKQPLP